VISTAAAAAAVAIDALMQPATLLSDDAPDAVSALKLAATEWCVQLL
jgi:hypothetical protein